MLPLIRDLIKPYKGSLFIILAAMVVQIVASLAAPWPLKVVLDNVIGSHKEPAWMTHLLGRFGPRHLENAHSARRGIGRFGDCVRQRGLVLRRQLLHRKRRPVGGSRPAKEDLPPSGAAFADLLRRPSNRQYSEHHHERHRHDSGLSHRRQPWEFWSTCSPSSR